MSYRLTLPHTRPEDDPAALEKLQSDLLNRAEELFGERDTSWNLCPPMFGTRNPHIFFPDSEDLKLVQIKLGRGARDKWTIVLYQMAHEVIHLLNPLHPEQGKANYLEEGVACAFSAYAQRRCGITGSDFVRDNLPAYEYALKQVKRLPKGGVSAAQRIRQEMPVGTSFSSVTSKDLLRIFPRLNKVHADTLTAKFERDRTKFP